MKKIKKLLYVVLAAVMVMPMTSCESYLNKAPSSDITEADVYGDFASFQGFIESLYKCIADPDKCGAWNNYSFADENLGPSIYPFDLGDYWNASGYLYGRTANPQDNTTRNRRVWEWSWYAIRKANLALEALDPAEGESLFHGTEEEYKLLKGQALFFRGFFYFEICRFWGGMPYITHSIGASEDMTTEEYTRLNFQQTALEMVKDFRAAADILPVNWDETTAGQATKGHNAQRVNKFFALGYLGKAYLYAASPMINEEATGSNTFDPALCQKAAEAFGEMIELAKSTGRYKLQNWATYDDIFFRFSNKRPGGTEGILMPTIYENNRTRWSAMGGTVPGCLGMNSGSSGDVPTENIVKNFGMANGLPLDDPDSGYDPQDPWKNRDPRFYKSIIKHGDRICNISGKPNYAKLEVGGQLRTKATNNPPCATGYYQRKFNGMGKAFTNSSVNGLQAYQPFLRLSDCYLMYAEAVNWMTGGGPKAKASNCSLTAEDAVNAIRNRATVPNLTAKYTASKEVFFDNLIRERAVELFMEGARFCDLRRWNLNYDPKYLNKTAIDFDLDANGKPCNFRERVVITRAASKKHNWLPIQVKYTKIYKGFYQNPGW